MEKNSEPSKTFTHMVKRFLTKVVRSFNGEKTVFPKTVLGELNIHMPRNEAQFSSVTQSCPTLCDPVGCSRPDLPFHHQLPDFTQTHVHWVGDDIQPSYPLLIPSLPIFNLSQHQGRFKWGCASHQVAKVLEFQLRHQSFHQIFRVDCLWDRLVGTPCSPRTLKSLLKHHSSKASILQCSAFLIVQLSHPYMTTGKTTDLTRWTSVGKVMSLLLQMLSRLVIPFP